MKNILWATGLLVATTLPTTFAQTPDTVPQPAPTRAPGLGGLGGILEQILRPGSGSTTSAGLGGLSALEIAQGLREALRVGIDKGATQASARDGYYRNPLIRIVFPPEAQRVATRLRQLGFSRQVDQFELSLNRAAEDAAKRARPVFFRAITQMTIPDAVGILRGPDNAATEYLRRTSGDELVRQFTPIVDSTLRRNNATRYYGDLVRAYNRLPMVQPVNPNLTEYATGKAVDGLFVLVAQEEKRIRENPAARVSDILRRVFGRT